MTDDVRRAAAADGDAVAEILTDGFAADPVMTWVFGADAEPARRAFFAFMVEEALLPLGATWTTNTCSVVWTPPDQDPWAAEGLAERFMTELAPRLDRGQLERLMTLNATTEVHPTEPHWYLAMLATRRQAQGSGAGTRVLRQTLLQVDADGLPAYLESTNPANVPFYERHGFAGCGEIRLPDGPTLTRMWRPAAGG